MCFPAGTLIRLADGTHRAIDELRPLDRVMTAEGMSGLVVKVGVRFHDEGLVRIRLRGRSDGLRCTAEHPILTHRGYVPAGELRLRDEVALPRRTWHERDDLFLPGVIATWPKESRRVHHAGGVATVVSAPPTTVKLDFRFGRLLGLYAAEGYARKTRSQVSFSFGKHEAETLVPETVELLRDLLGIEARVQHRAHNVVIVNVGGKHWCEMFTALCGQGAKGKRLAIDGPPEFKRGFFSGWMDGDGWKPSKKPDRALRHIGVTISHCLALDAWAIGNDLGIAPTLAYSDPKLSGSVRQRRYDLTFAPEAKNPHSRLTDEACWRRVTALEHEDFAGYVYNLEVEGDHSYVAEGFGVHNCVAYTSASIHQHMQWADHGKFLTFDPAELYTRCKERDGFAGEGTFIRIAMAVMRERGMWARKSRYLAADAVFPIQSYVRLRAAQEIKEALYTVGPVAFGTMVDEGIYKPVPRTGKVAVLPPPAPSKKIGGHAMCVVGYDATDGLLLKNSWNTSWGTGGYAWMGWGYLTTYPAWDAWRSMDLPDDVLAEILGG